MRYLQFRNMKTGETARRIDVTGRSEREIERIMRGMLINIDEDWIVDDIDDDQDHSLPVGEAGPAEMGGGE